MRVMIKLTGFYSGKRTMRSLCHLNRISEHLDEVTVFTKDPANRCLQPIRSRGDKYRTFSYEKILHTRDPSTLGLEALTIPHLISH
jgi:hypothetical protein